MKPSIPCPHAAQCGGCQLLALPYERQLEQKQASVVRLMPSGCEIHPILPSPDALGYRHKCQVAFRRQGKNEIVFGTYAPNSHRLVPFTKCLLHHPAADPIFRSIASLAKQFRIEPFDDRKGTGFLRHAMVRCGRQTGEILVVLVTARSMFPGSRNFVRRLLALHPEITTVVQNINPDFTSMVLGRQEKVLYGSGFIRDKLCGMTFQLSAASFFQVNPAQTERLYQAAIGFAGLTGKETVIDAYCGTGTIGLLAAPHAKRVLGFEQNRHAVQDAVRNAKRNRVSNISFVCADAGQKLVELAAQGKRADVVFTDPPRSGCSEHFLQALLEMQPEKIVYISCNPETQARDIQMLAPLYRTQAVQPVDLFPQTEHCENIALLVRQQKE